jgi:ubiquinone/menaquinone biosynthesis C-methylase UbiE
MSSVRSLKKDSSRCPGVQSTHRQVKGQYESYPYPHRDPEDERNRLIPTVGDNLDKVMHYCFGGKQRHLHDFRVLVAGGGTGDATIYLAEQLRDLPAQLVYLDMSEGSSAVAQKRAAIRGLRNIEWVNASIQDIPKLNLGHFDYINCSGVLHHLQHPVEGLKILANSLSQKGSINLMVYGKYGRRSIYEMQELMRLINGAEPSMKAKLHNAKKVLEHLPEQNPFQQSYAHWQTDIEHFGDAGIVDLILHAQDQSFSVPELYALCDQVDMSVVAFIGDLHEGPMGYQPEHYIQDPELLGKVKNLDQRKQQAIAELISGSISKHTIYLSKQSSPGASIFDVESIPFLSNIDEVNFLQQVRNLNVPKITLSGPKGDATFVLDKESRCLLSLLDGHRCVADVIIEARQRLGETQCTIRDMFLRLHEVFNFFFHQDCMFLKKSERAVADPYTQAVVNKLI